MASESAPDPDGPGRAAAEAGEPRAPVECVLIGAGNRGRDTYAAYALAHPERLRIVALAEPREGLREAAARDLSLPDAALHADWRELLARPRQGRAAIVATPDTLHVEPAIAAVKRGYHLLLEKPIAMDPAACVRVVREAESSGRMLQIAHVLRYTPFYRKVHEILASGRLGRVVHLDLREHVAHWHMTHSFVRGKFRHSSIAAPLLLAKCCHDLDLIAWLSPSPVRRVSSFGGLSHYRREEAPPGAPERCTDPCPVRESCPHDALRFYAGPPETIARLWPWADLSRDPSRAARELALETGPYGRCVYRCDNDVNDHQSVALEFADGATASFGVHGHGTRELRTLRVSGTRGELRGVMQDGLLEVTTHGSLETERFELPTDALGHYGGDGGLLDHFTDLLSRDALGEVRTGGRVSLESHLLGFAAEESRHAGTVLDFGEYRERFDVDA